MFDCEIAEPGQHDGAVERHQAAHAMDGQMQRRDVGISEEDLRIAPDQRVVDRIQQHGSAIAAAHAEHALHVRIGKHGMQVFHPLADRPAEIALAAPDVAAHFAAQSELFNCSLRQPQAVGVGNVGRRRDEADRVARAQCARPGQSLRRLRECGGRHGGKKAAAVYPVHSVQSKEWGQARGRRSSAGLFLRCCGIIRWCPRIATARPSPWKSSAACSRPRCGRNCAELRPPSGAPWRRVSRTALLRPAPSAWALRPIGGCQTTPIRSPAWLHLLLEEAAERPCP